MNKIPNILTVDVEDWFHICALDNGNGNVGIWNKYESRVVSNTERILSILKSNNTNATFFFLGWVAEQYPQLVVRTKGEGHEIATHGYAHKLVYEQSPEEFLADLNKSVEIIENITKSKVIGNRSAGFSITEKTPWAFEMITKAGLQYDSTVFPASRGHGGLVGAERNIHIIKTSQGSIQEFPISIINVFGQDVAFSGGGYLRLYPYWFIKSSIARLNKKGIPAVVYLHPRDLDTTQPRMKMPFKRRFKSYVNISTTENKVKSLLCDFNFVSIKEVIKMEEAEKSMFKSL